MQSWHEGKLTINIVFVLVIIDDNKIVVHLIFDQLMAGQLSHDVCKPASRCNLGEEEARQVRDVRGNNDTCYAGYMTFEFDTLNFALITCSRIQMETGDRHWSPWQEKSH